MRKRSPLVRGIFAAAIGTAVAAAGVFASVALTGGTAADSTATQTFTFTNQGVVTYTIPTVTETVTVTQPPAPPPAPPPPPPAADYWVGPSGSDTNPGTYAQPFATIQHAADIVASGQKVGVQDGVYSAVQSGNHCLPSTTKYVVCLWKGGTSAAHVTFFAEHKWGAVIDGQHLVDDGFDWGSGASYIDVDGFEVRGLVTTSGGSVSGFELNNGGLGSKVSNCKAHDIGKTTSSSTNGFVGVFIAQNNVTVQGCYMFDIGRVNAVNLDHGVYLNQGNNALITGNYFDTFLNGWAIQVYPTAETGTQVTNNTFIGGKPTTSYTHIILGTNLTGGTWTGNVFWSANTSLTLSQYQGTYSGVTFSNNTATGPRWCDKTSGAGACTTSGSLPTGFSGTGNVLNAQIPKPPPPS